MPILQDSGQFNTGRDCQVVLIGPFGRVELNNVTGFDAKQDTIHLHANLLNGTKLNAEIPDGWSGSLNVDRGDNALDVLAAGMETQWFAGGQFSDCTMFQYVQEAGGAQTVFAYDNVCIKLSDAGNWQPDAIVKQRLDWYANRRRIV